VSRLTKAPVFFVLAAGVALPSAFYASLTMSRRCDRIAAFPCGANGERIVTGEGSATAVSRY